ncbi:MAG: tripartite tricarboxylate transporter substrate binding protein [Proteobacteria bacterium]|nr:tripartite tricarboxylate transporter substrate binding protein [Pseudomonadota bacterium]
MNSVLHALVLAAALFAGAALAQGYPAKPVRIIVPYPPGGGTDVVARAIAQKFQESTGQAMVVDNRPGASELIGTEAAAKAAPDGYTMLLTTNAYSINASLLPKLPYDSANGFIPVTLLATAPFAFVVNPQVPVKTMQELAALARAQPGRLNYASLGSGSPHQMAMEYFKKLAGIDIVGIPYKGLAPALTAGIAGEVQVVVTGLTAGLAQVRAGKLRALAVTTSKPSTAAPELPTVADSGFPGYDLYAWYGVLLPAGTPTDIVAKLNAELVKALNAPDIKERFKGVGVDTAPMTPAAFADFMREDLQLWTRIVKLVDAKPE